METEDVRRCCTNSIVRDLPNLQLRYEARSACCFLSGIWIAVNVDKPSVLVIEASFQRFSSGIITHHCNRLTSSGDITINRHAMRPHSSHTGCLLHEVRYVAFLAHGSTRRPFLNAGLSIAARRYVPHFSIRLASPVS